MALLGGSRFRLSYDFFRQEEKTVELTQEPSIRRWKSPGPRHLDLIVTTKRYSGNACCASG